MTAMWNMISTHGFLHPLHLRGSYVFLFTCAQTSELPVDAEM